MGYFSTIRWVSHGGKEKRIGVGEGERVGVSALGGRGTCRRVRVSACGRWGGGERVGVGRMGVPA
jgi:hypothetical protein